MFSKNKDIIIGLAVIILLAVGYLVFFNKSAPPDLTASTGGASSDELYFVNLSGELTSIAFDTDIFSDPRFTALVDIRTAILPEANGRSDPFAPIPGVSSSGK